LSLDAIATYPQRVDCPTIAAFSKRLLLTTGQEEHGLLQYAAYQMSMRMQSAGCSQQGNRMNAIVVNPGK